MRSDNRQYNESVNIRIKIDTFKEHACKIFDVASCKCADFTHCSCPKLQKVPLKERDFLSDQRGDRWMVIDSPDLIETEKLKKRVERGEAGALKRSYHREATT